MDSAAISKIPSDRLANFCATFSVARQRFSRAGSAVYPRGQTTARQSRGNFRPRGKEFFFLQLCGILDRKRRF